ncbi:hypothetical protein PGT21_021177 [Puccinia graminis f. sp. tritici]|uniref:Uncharacterized protein n=1 Tax=Puccinia graminis f. sp. tritici TaxID=56615 RepID=A0A5B0PSX8_PUCGR|nr:hypothetical protein PGT21_021177 [Puccinia graminis f. sp. tritici]
MALTLPIPAFPNPLQQLILILKFLWLCNPCTLFNSVFLSVIGKITNALRPSHKAAIALA